MTTIKLKNGSGAPAGGDLVQGEPALDLTNKRLYTENASGTVIEVGTNPGVDVTFADNRKAIFGAGSDLQIYHDGSGSFITDAGTGDLRIRSNKIRMEAPDSQNMIIVTEDAGVQAFYNGTQRLEVTNTGIDVTGSITTDGLTSVGGSISIGADGAGDDFRFYGDTSGRYMEWVSSADSLLFRDGAKALFGNGSDLQIYHDGSNSYIVDAGTGDLYFRSASNLYIGNAAGTQSYITAADGGAVDLRYNGSAKLATTSTGIDVTGTVTADVVAVNNDAASITIANDASNRYQRFRRNASNSLILDKYNGTTTTNTAKFDENGDISFYEDTGTTAKLFWDASAERLGLGTSSPARQLHIQSNGPDAYLKLNSTGNNSSALLELANDATTWTAGVNSTDTFVINNGANERMRIDSSGNVGIGTSSPRNDANFKTLQIGDSSTAASQLVLDDNDSSGPWRIISNLSLIINDDTDERMRIDSSGNLLVGTTSTLRSNKFHVNASNFVGGFNVTGGTGEALAFFSNGTVVGSVSVTGSATTYNTSSDQRLKENIVDAPSASDDIDAIQVRSFDWKADDSHQKYGMVAQELQSVAPEAVTGDADSDDMMGVDYSKLVPMMLKEIQSLRARVAQLETN